MMWHIVATTILVLLIAREWVGYFWEPLQTQEDLIFTQIITLGLLVAITCEWMG